jgi:hypothetical protein
VTTPALLLLVRSNSRRESLALVERMADDIKQQQRLEQSGAAPDWRTDWRASRSRSRCRSRRAPRSI